MWIWKDNVPPTHPRTWILNWNRCLFSLPKIQLEVDLPLLYPLDHWTSSINHLGDHKRRHSVSYVHTHYTLYDTNKWVEAQTTRRKKDIAFGHCNGKYHAKALLTSLCTLFSSLHGPLVLPCHSCMTNMHETWYEIFIRQPLWMGD